MLLIAGHETTVNLIANGTLTLLRNPELPRAAAHGPEFSLPLVEELLRFEPPVQYIPNRTPLADIESRHDDPEGRASIVLLLAAATAIRALFDHPDRFDPDRPGTQHLGFGGGIHYCFGAPLARLEVSSPCRARRPAREPATDRRPSALPPEPRAAGPAPPGSRLDGVVA